MESGELLTMVRPGSRKFGEPTNRDRGRIAPPPHTPPSMRIRTRRFVLAEQARSISLRG